LTHVLTKALTLVAHVHGTVVIGNVATIVTVGEVGVHTSVIGNNNFSREGVASVVVLLSVVIAAVVLLEVFVGAVITVHGAIVVIAVGFAFRDGLNVPLVIVFTICARFVSVLIEGTKEVELCGDDIIPFFYVFKLTQVRNALFLISAHNQVGLVDSGVARIEAVGDVVVHTSVIGNKNFSREGEAGLGINSISAVGGFFPGERTVVAIHIAVAIIAISFAGRFGLGVVGVEDGR